MPEQNMPEQGVPERQGAPEQNSPEQNSSEQNVPELNAPDPGVPDPGVPERRVPGPGVPGRNVSHPIFARLFQRVSPRLDAAGGADHRRRLLAGLRGRVIEIGAGAGSNFRHYPPTVTEVLAVEPEPRLRAAAAAAAAAGVGAAGAARSGGPAGGAVPGATPGHPSGGSAGGPAGSSAGSVPGGVPGGAAGSAPGSAAGSVPGSAAGGRPAGTPVVTVVDGVAEHLPVADGSMDAAVVSLVLCSVRDQAVALAEVYRVLRPGGELRFYEHVRAEDSPVLRRVQRLADATVWPLLCGGCHTGRDTVGAIRAAGLTITELSRFRFPDTRLSATASPHVRGTAVKPGHKS